MVRNVRPGPDWIACTVLEVLGPVTYIVQTDGSKWKRHADQLKDWLPFTYTFSKVTPDSVPDEVEAPPEQWRIQGGSWGAMDPPFPG